MPPAVPTEMDLDDMNIEMNDILEYAMSGAERLVGLTSPSPFHIITFVDELEELDIADIPAEDNKCSICWLPFGVTDADDPDYVPDAVESEEQATALAMFAEMPFDRSRMINDPVETPCGHVFGKTCLIDSLQMASTRCPMCRMELSSALEEDDVYGGGDGNEDHGDADEEEGMELAHMMHPHHQLTNDQENLLDVHPPLAYIDSDGNVLPEYTSGAFMVTSALSPAPLFETDVAMWDNFASLGDSPSGDEDE
jgi:hypothetical protein